MYQITSEYISIRRFGFKCFLIYYRKKDESKESDFTDAVGVCLPLITATIRDIEKGVFPKDCSLNIEIPTSPSSNKVCIFDSRD